MPSLEQLKIFEGNAFKSLKSPSFKFAKFAFVLKTSRRHQEDIKKSNFKRAY